MFTDNDGTAYTGTGSNRKLEEPGPPVGPLNGNGRLVYVEI
jgi:hypothetical protein